MSKITNREILEFLKDEGVLYELVEDEDSDGELEITGTRVRIIRDIMKDLREKQKEKNDLISRLKKKIRSKDNAVYFDKLDPIYLNGSSLDFGRDCYFLDCTNMIMSGCFLSCLGVVRFVNKEKVKNLKLK